jgi:hypothetical protein
VKVETSQVNQRTFFNYSGFIFQLLSNLARLATIAKYQCDRQLFSIIYKTRTANEKADPLSNIVAML